VITELLEGNIIWNVVDFADEPYYDQEKDIVRVVYDGELYDAFIAFTGVRFKPRKGIHRAIWFHSPSLKGKEVRKEDPIGSKGVTSVVILVYASSFSEYSVASGGSPKALVNAPSEVGEGDDVVIHGRSADDPVARSGISVRRDGSILIKGTSVIIENQDGILISGGLTRTGTSESAGGLVKSSVFPWIPSFVAMPNPQWWPDIEKLVRIGSIVKACYSLKGKVKGNGFSGRS